MVSLQDLCCHSLLAHELTVVTIGAACTATSS
jgi:hypothetical protein